MQVTSAARKQKSPVALRRSPECLRLECLKVQLAVGRNFRQCWTNHWNKCQSLPSLNIAMRYDEIRNKWKLTIENILIIYLFQFDKHANMPASVFCPSSVCVCVPCIPSGWIVSCNLLKSVPWHIAIDHRKYSLCSMAATNFRTLLNAADSPIPAVCIKGQNSLLVYSRQISSLLLCSTERVPLDARSCSCDMVKA